MTPAASGNMGRFQYTGQMWIAEAGLYHFKARAYHPGLGRFLQTDPIGIAGGMNLYGYVGNDPVNAADPSGLMGSCTGSHINSGGGCWGQPGFMCTGDCGPVGGTFGMMNPIGALPPSPAVGPSGGCWEGQQQRCPEEFGVWTFAPGEADAAIAGLEAEGWTIHAAVKARVGQTVVFNYFTNTPLPGTSHAVVVAVDPATGTTRATRAGLGDGSGFVAQGIFGHSPLQADAFGDWRATPEYGSLRSVDYVGVSNVGINQVGSLMQFYAGSVNAASIDYGFWRNNSNSYAMSFVQGVLGFHGYQPDSHAYPLGWRSCLGSGYAC